VYNTVDIYNGDKLGVGEKMELKLGDKIRQKRKHMGLTLKELAGERVTAAQISAIEKGKCRPSPGLLQYICERLEVDVEYFTLSQEERARKRFEEAKEKSQRLYDEGKYDEASNIINEAADIVSYLFDSQKGFFYYLQGNCFYDRGEFIKAFDIFVKALTYYLKTKDIDITADIYIKIGNCLFNTRKEDMALGYYLNAYQYAGNNLNMDIRARILYNLSLCYISLKRYSLSREFLDKCTDFVEKHEWPKKERFFPGLEMMRGTLDRELNQNKESLQRFDQAFTKYKVDGDIAGMGRARNNAAVCLWDMGDMEAVIKYLQEAIDYKTISGDATLIDTYMNLAEAHKEMGNIDKAIEVINIAEEKMLKNNNVKGLIEVFLTKFDYFTELKEFERAEIFAFIALDYIQKLGDIKEESNLYIKLSDMYRNMGDEKTSIDYVVKAKSLMM
jgi:HTH-type transcriptional regulator, quorum sensing regulator NprR